MSRNMHTFYVLVVTQTLSFLGSRVSSLAIGIWIYIETGQATPLALVSFFTALPAVFAQSISGVLADRWDRRYVMALADAGQAIGTIILFFSFATGSFELWHLYVVVLIQAVFGVFQSPAFDASITMLVQEDQRVRANALRQLTGPVASVISPLIATTIFALTGVLGAIILDLATFVIAVTVVLRVQIPRPAESDTGRRMRGSIWREAWGGFQYLWEQRPLFIMIVYYALVNFLFSGATIFAVPYFLARTDNNEAALGVLLALINGGAVAGSLAIAYFNIANRRVMVLCAGAVVTGLMLAVGGMSQSVLALAPIFFIVMFPIPIGNTLFISILQAKVPADVQGRVFAVMGQMVRLLMPLAFLIAGPLADEVFEPALTVPQWGEVTPLTGDVFEPLVSHPQIDLFVPLVGAATGAGMGLIMVINGILLVTLALGLYSIKQVRQVESDLPDHAVTYA